MRMAGPLSNISAAGGGETTHDEWHAQSYGCREPLTALRPSRWRHNLSLFVTTGRWARSSVRRVVMAATD